MRTNLLQLMRLERQSIILIDSDNGANGTIVEEDGVLHVQKCLNGEYYYESCEIYGDTDRSATIMAHSTDT